MHTYAYVEPTQHTKDLGALAQLPLSISSEFDRFRIRLFASLKEVFRQHLASRYAVPLRRRTRCTTSPNLVVRPSLRASLTEPSPNSASGCELVWSGVSAPRLTRPLPWSSVSGSLAGAMATVCSLFWSYYRTVLQGRTTHASEPTRLPTQLKRVAQYQISALSDVPMSAHRSRPKLSRTLLL